MSYYLSYQKQLERRKLKKALNGRLSSYGLRLPHRWVDVAGALEMWVSENKISRDELLGAFLDVALFSNKRIFVLTSKLSHGAVAKLSKDSLRTADLWPHVGGAAKLTCSAKPRYDVTIGGVSARVIPVIRYVADTPTDVSVGDLTPSAQKLYSGADVIARTRESFRCYDVVVTLPTGASLFMIDELVGIARDQKNAQIRYVTSLIEADLGSSGIIDLFPALQPIYDDDAEGVVNKVWFESNGSAQQVGRYSANSTEDYRKQAFHAAGAKAAQVDVYGLAVRWPEIAGAPLALLKGKQNMLEAMSEGKRSMCPLKTFETPFPIDGAGLTHVVSHILSHLG